MKAYATWLDVALRAADEAGTLLRQRWQQTHAVHRKGFRDIVTETDTAVEALILGRLRAAFPDHAMTSEEAGADAEDAPVRWVVDPLDGTTNFSRNNPNFSTSIAAVDEGEAVVGVILDPLRGHVFAARKDGGATLNGVPIHCSNVTALEAAIFGVDTPREPALRREMWARAGALLTRARTMRALGSAALNMAYVAAGWTDLYMGIHLSPWDHAAAGLIVQEAGGYAATVSGEPWTPFRRDPLMAATPALAAAFRALYEASSERQ